MAMVRFSIQPSSRRRATKAFVQGLKAVGSAPRNPMVGSFPACCALDPSGQNVAAPAMALTKSRRRIAAPLQDHANNIVNYSRDLGVAEWDSTIRSAQSGPRVFHRSTKALRSSLPRSVLGSEVASTI